MMLSDTLNEALNAQVGHEMAASMQYVAIASYFDGRSLGNLAAFFYRQADEERDHAMRFQKFLVDSDGQLSIPAIPAPTGDFGAARDAVALALESEKRVTGQIYDLVTIANEDRNHIATRFLDWFVNEQFEEVTTMSELLDVVEMAGEDKLLSVEEYLERRGDPHADEA